MKLPETGVVLADKYRLDEVIGEGGFACVYRAVDLTVHRPVAVKVLRPKSDGYPPNLASRFIREAQVLAGLTDPYTIRMFDFGRDADGLLFMVFELLGGQDLSDFIADHGTLNEQQTEHVIRQILSSLREAHGQGLLHRDIKPMNVRIYEYMGDPFRAKLMDFGIARQVGPDAVSLTKTGDLVGTLAYMAPEQAIGTGLTAAADLYAVGLLAYEMLTGSSRPARAATASGTVIHAPCSEPLASAIVWMLKPAPGDRPQTAEQVLNLLDGPNPTGRQPVNRSSDSGASAPASGSQGQRLQRASSTVSTRDAGGSTERIPAVRQRIAWAVAAVALIAIVIELAVFFTRDPAPRPEAASVNPSLVVAERRESTPTQPAEPAEPAAATATATTTADGGTDTGPAEALRTCVSAPAQEGMRSLRFRDGLVTHTFNLFVPQSYEPSKPGPLMVVFHTDFDSPRQMVNQSGLKWLANDLDIVLLAPLGTDNEGLGSWRQPVDPVVIRGMIDAVAADVCIDLSRIYLLGHGSGGTAAEQLLCEPWASALITTSNLLNVGDQPCLEPKPTLFFHPSESRHVPMEGGANCSATRKLISVKEQEAVMQKRNRCKGRPTVTKGEGEVCLRWDCEAPTVSCHVESGHNWPGMPKRAIDLLNCDGPQGNYDYLGKITEFLKGL